MHTQRQSVKKGFVCKMITCVFVLLQIQNVCAEEISKEFQSDIVRLLKITGAEAIGIQMGVAVTNHMIDSLVKQDPEIPPNAVASIKDEISIVIAEEMPKLMTEIVPIYAKHFTQEEIKGLIAFYSTPLGKKSIEAMPAVMNECMQAGQEWGKSISPRLISRLETRLKKEDYDDK